ncbi:MAG TPA: M17 family peptidase N-terminal domain-containing protein, partial [Thiolinea sp.]|nr:M17 family peptidase N-terminal domain-containing protein [Thiolinea sp.]
MEYRFQASAPAAQLEADCMVVGIYKDRDAALSRAAAQLDQASAGGLGAHLALGDFNARKHETQLLYGLTGIKARRVLLVGLGERAKLTSEVLAQASRTAARQLKSANIRHAVSFLSDESGSEHRAEAVRQAIRAVAEALYSFNAYKSGEAENDRTALAQWDIAHTEAGDLSAAIQQGQAIAAGCHLARDLGNLPGNVCTPAYLAETASGLVNEHAGMMQVEILEESDMEALGMGAFMSVSKGSSQPGKLVSIHCNGGRQGDAPVVLV